MGSEKHHMMFARHPVGSKLSLRGSLVLNQTDPKVAVASPFPPGLLPRELRGKSWKIMDPNLKAFLEDFIRGLSAATVLDEGEFALDSS